MIQANGQNGNHGAGTIQEPAAHEPNIGPPSPGTGPIEGQEPATRAKQRAKQTFQQNRFVIVAGGAVVAALLVYVATFMPARRPAQKSSGASGVTAKNMKPESSPTPGDKSLFPITDSGSPAAKETHDGFLNERDLDRTASGRHPSITPGAGQANAPGTLGSIPPFGDTNWQAPPYQPGTSGTSGGAADDGKQEREAMEKPSLVYVRSVSAAQGSSRGGDMFAAPSEEIGLGLATGIRLRARRESAASTAVRTPVLAVIEYNYERDGEIIVPAGAKAVGHLQDADRSGYVRVEFHSLLMPDGAEVPFQAVATDLEMRPLKGKVEGKNTGKNVLIRSLSGIGQAGTMVLGRGNLNQPLSESDLLRERVGNNIGEAGDEQISRMAVTQHIVVTIDAGTPIYLVLEKTPKSGATARRTIPSTQTGAAMNAEDLRQLLQLQRELNQENPANQ